MYHRPAKNGQFPPPEGWVPNAYYVVAVAWRRSNPVHKALLYTGQPNPVTGSPFGEGAGITEASYEGQFYSPNDAYYLEYITPIGILNDLPPDTRELGELGLRLSEEGDDAMETTRRYLELLT